LLQVVHIAKILDGFDLKRA